MAYLLQGILVFLVALSGLDSFKVSAQQTICASCDCNMPGSEDGHLQFQAFLQNASSQMAAVTERLDAIMEKVEGVDSRLETVEGNVEKITPPPAFQRAYRIFLMKSPRGDYRLTLAGARRLCAANNMQLATATQLEAGFHQGLNQRSCGWLDDGTSRFAVQYPEDWAGGKLRKAGIMFCTWQSRWNAYCFNSVSLAAKDNE